MLFINLLLYFNGVSSKPTNEEQLIFMSNSITVLYQYQWTQKIRLHTIIYIKLTLNFKIFHRNRSYIKLNITV